MPPPPSFDVFTNRIRSLALSAPLVVLFVALHTGVASSRSDGERLEEVRQAAGSLRADVASARQAARDARTPWPRVRTFEGRADLLSRDTLDFLRAQRAAAPDSAERRLLEVLELDLARWSLLAAVAPLDDRLAALGTALKADVDGVDNSLTLNELHARIPAESDSLHRRMLLAARAGLWAEHADPLLAERSARLDSLARALGYPDETTLAVRAMGVGDIREVLAQLLLFTRATDHLYRILIGEFAGIPERRALAGRGDIALALAERHHRRTEFDAMFLGYEAELLSRATFDLGLQPPVAAASPALRAPSGLPDLAPEPANAVVPDLVGEWRERGEALHRTLQDEQSAEFREAGPGTIPKAGGELLAGLLTTPAWLQQWRETSAAAGRPEPARWGDPSIARYVRWRIWCELDRIRVDFAAALLHELVAQEAGEDYWQPFFLTSPPEDRRENWRQLLVHARGGVASAEEAWDHQLRAQRLLAGVEEVRALALAAAVDESLVLAHGENWFRVPAARQALREGLFLKSSAHDADAVARAFGHEELSLEPLRRRLERLFEWSDGAGGGLR